MTEADVAASRGPISVEIGFHATVRDLKEAIAAAVPPGDPRHIAASEQDIIHIGRACRFDERQALQCGIKSMAFVHVYRRRGEPAPEPAAKPDATRRGLSLMAALLEAVEQRPA